MLKRNKHITTVRVAIITLFVGSFALLALFPDNVSAQGNQGCETDTIIISCDNVNGSGEIENTGLWSLLLMIVNILTAGVGVVALGGIIYGSILYTSSAGNPEQVKKAMTVIRNVIIGVVAFAAMFAVLNFLVPGGVFR